MVKGKLTGLLTTLLLLAPMLKGQEQVAPFSTFKTTRIINAHSSETLFKRHLDFRVTHRFGDIGGSSGGFHNFYGLDNARDIRIAFEYGIIDDLDIGIGRSKGAGPQREIFDGFAKYRFFQQGKDGGSPVNLTGLVSTACTAMEPSGQETLATAFTNWDQRLTYTYQALLSRRFSDRFSMELMPTYIHRNFVAFEDQNTFFAIGTGGTIKISKLIGVTAEYFYTLPNARTVGNTEYHNPLAIGVEIETGGHVFHLNLMNSGGIGESQFIPYTASDWLEGEFRFGFNISRTFKL